MLGHLPPGGLILLFLHYKFIFIDVIQLISRLTVSRRTRAYRKEG